MLQNQKQKEIRQPEKHCLMYKDKKISIWVNYI